MPGRSRPLQRHIGLSPRALVAAERLGEAAGMSATEMLEMILLELLDSGLPIEAGHQGPSSRTGQRRSKPASVIPIERGRRCSPLRALSTFDMLRERSLAARQRSSAARQRGTAAREAAVRIREKGVGLRHGCANS